MSTNMVTVELYLWLCHIGLNYWADRLISEVRKLPHALKTQSADAQKLQ